MFLYLWCGKRILILRLKLNDLLPWKFYMDLDTIWGLNFKKKEDKKKKLDKLYNAFKRWQMFISHCSSLLLILILTDLKCKLLQIRYFEKTSTSWNIPLLNIFIRLTGLCHTVSYISPKGTINVILLKKLMVHFFQVELHKKNHHVIECNHSQSWNFYENHY